MRLKEHDEKQCICNHCDNEFANEVRLKEHERIHTEEKTIQLQPLRQRIRRLSTSKGT